MKNLFVKFLFIFIAVLAVFVLISYFADVGHYFNSSFLFSGKLTFITRLLIFIPYAFSLSLFISILFFISKSASSGIFASLFVILILAFALLDFVYVKHTSIKSPLASVDNISKNKREIEKVKTKELIKSKINRTLDTIYFTGRYDIALDIINSPLNATTSVNENSKPVDTEKTSLRKNRTPENMILSQLKNFTLKKIKLERLLSIKANKRDPDFQKGYRYLINGRFSNAYSHFSSNRNSYSNYFMNKSLALIRRQGQKDVEEKFQILRRIRQLKQLGKKIEISFKNDPKTVYDYYYSMQNIYGDMGSTNEITKYSRLISLNQITENELDILKELSSFNNLVYVTNIQISAGNKTNKHLLKRALISIKKAYYLESSATIYFLNTTVYTEDKNTYEIGVIRLYRNKGIFKNFTGGNGKVIHDGIISISHNPMDIIKFKGIYPHGKYLSVFTLFRANKNSLVSKLFVFTLKDRINYYAGLILSFIFVFIIANFTRQGIAVKINKVLWTLPILVIIIFSYFITHFSFYISNEFIKLIM